MKVLVQNYTFDAALGTVTFNDYNAISLEGILLITNVTNNQIIYNFANPSLGGSVVGNVLNLTFDTSTMNSTDALQIFYDNGGVMVPETLVEAIYDLVQAMQAITGAKGNLADLRVQLTSAPITMSGVSTLSNQTSMGGYSANSQIKDLDNLLVQSTNINNITEWQ